MKKKSNQFIPNFSITENTLNNIARIYSSVAIIEKSPLIPKWEISLRKEALIRSAHASTAIEGNPLTLGDVTDLAEGRQIMAQKRAKAEVLNYLNVLEKIPELAKQELSEKLIFDIHKKLTREVLDKPKDAGRYRTVSVVVGNRITGKVSFRPPSFKQVPGLMKAFVRWLQSSGDVHNPVIQAGITHYEFVRIHPFVDGNGRTARTLASLVLCKRGFDTKRFFALDDFYDQDRPAYYQALQTVDPKSLDLTGWIEYFCEGVMIQVEEVRRRILTLSPDMQKIKAQGQIALNERQMKIVEYVHSHGKITNREVQKIFSVSNKTAAEYLARLMTVNVLKSEGKGRSVAYGLK